MLPGAAFIDAAIEPTWFTLMVGAPGTATGVPLTELDADPLCPPATASISTE